MTRRLYVGNLAYSLTESDLRDVFAEAGPVAEVKVILDRETGRPRGFAFVEMGDESGAAKAMEVLNGREIQGRPIAVREAQERSGGGGGRGGGGGGGGGGGWDRDRGGGRGGGGGGGADWGGGGGGRDRDRGDRGDRGGRRGGGGGRW